MDKKIAELRTQVTQLGKEVAESHSTTQFPEWIHFKIGISTIEGYPYEHEWWVSRAKWGVGFVNGQMMPEEVKRMEKPKTQDFRTELLKLQAEKEKYVAQAQEIVTKHLEPAIERGDSATVAAMAEILKI